jgi:hypothetical protein
MSQPARAAWQSFDGGQDVGMLAVGHPPLSPNFDWNDFLFAQQANGYYRAYDNWDETSAGVIDSYNRDMTDGL